MEITYHVSQIDQVAAQLWQNYKDHKTWAFYAPMGAGKTTLIKALCQQVLQCPEIVTSPTFAIINEYTSPSEGTIYHMDWYRLQDEQEAVSVGVEETLNSNHLCLVEWPEKAPLLLPEHTLMLQMEILAGEERKIWEK